MINTPIGQYVDERTGGQYEVIKRETQVNHNPLSGAKLPLKGKIDYITGCGFGLQELDESLTRFELIEKDAVIRKAKS